MPLSAEVKPIIDALGGPTKAGRRLGVPPAQFYAWARIPARWVDRVSEASGIPPARLRPDLFKEGETDG